MDRDRLQGSLVIHIKIIIFLIFQLFIFSVPQRKTDIWYIQKTKWGPGPTLLNDIHTDCICSSNPTTAMIIYARGQSGQWSVVRGYDFINKQWITYPDIPLPPYMEGAICTTVTNSKSYKRYLYPNYFSYISKLLFCSAIWSTMQHPAEPCDIL